MTWTHQCSRWYNLHHTDFRVFELGTQREAEAVHCRFSGAVVGNAWSRGDGERRSDGRDKRRTSFGLRDYNEIYCKKSKS